MPRHIDLEIGLRSPSNIQSLYSRGYAFHGTVIDHENHKDEPGLAILEESDLYSRDTLIRQAAVAKFELDLGYTQYHSCSWVMVPGPPTLESAVIFAQAIRSVFTTHPYVNMSILLPLCKHPLGSMHHIDQEDEDEEGWDYLGTWSIWNTIRSVCHYSPRLQVALSIPAKLPNNVVLSRWLCEPIKLLVVSAQVYLTNQKGYPVLPKAHQNFIQSAACQIRPRVSIMLEDTYLFQRLGGEDAYLQYLKHLLKSCPDPSATEASAEGFQDFLQKPLQPLIDNLSSATYEVFERDPVKYIQYEKAMFAAFCERPRGIETIVAVVGAGRGPLVECALRASEESETPITLFAIEKNAHAITGLKHKVANEWAGRVELVETDMRVWEPDQFVDILISELLGSFGDNELSPECSDGVQHVLHPETGISIPSRYTPFVTPLMTPKLHTQLLHTDEPRNLEATALETGYVTLLTQCDFLSNDFSPLWHFYHPNVHMNGLSLEERQVRNKRYGKATFQVGQKGMCHGIAGYFEAVLFDNVELSTVPSTIEEKSPDMASWFPMFWPLKSAYYCPADSIINVHFWRETNGKKVWYEYMAEGFYAAEKIWESEMINQGGTKSWIGL